MATWGGIRRAIEEGLLDAGDYDSGGGSQNIAEALTGQDFTGFRMRDLFDKDRWSRREREQHRQGRRLEETGIPDYTYDYNPRDQAVTTGLGPQPNVQGQRISGGHAPATPGWHGSRPEGNIRQWGTQNPNVPGSMALDPTWAGGLRGAGLGAEMTPGDRLGEDRDLSGLSRDSRFATGTVPGNITGTRGYLPGRMSVGEARRARAIRNMSIRDRQEAGLGDLERYDEFGRISRNFDTRMGRLKNQLRDWDIEDRTRRPNIMGGGPSTRIQPNWGAIEEDMAMREMRGKFEGRDDR